MIEKKNTFLQNVTLVIFRVVSAVQHTDTNIWIIIINNMLNTDNNS